MHGGWGISVGFGKKKQQQAQEPTPEQLQGGWGISVGFGKKRGRPSKAALAHREEQRQLNGGWGISVGFGKKKKEPTGGWGVSFGSGAKKRHNPRAEIVRKVMHEQGLSMIEASKYVKAHNLY